MRAKRYAWPATQIRNPNIEFRCYSAKLSLRYEAREQIQMTKISLACGWAGNDKNTGKHIRFEF
jgi:hypothetical protein